eukprot:7263589-Alexandrium_andersonii.AAC.1
MPPQSDGRPAASLHAVSGDPCTSLSACGVHDSGDCSASALPHGTAHACAMPGQAQLIAHDAPIGLQESAVVGGAPPAPCFFEKPSFEAGASLHIPCCHAVRASSASTSAQLACATTRQGLVAPAELPKLSLHPFARCALELVHTAIPCE